jgi:hypothetical protein
MAFQLTALVESNALDVEFSLRNPLDVYVDQFEPTHLWPPTRGGYVYVHREDRLLVLYFGTVPNPPRVALMQEIKFYAERVPPGGTLRRSITLPLPILERGKLKVRDPAAPHDVVHVDRRPAALHGVQGAQPTWLDAPRGSAKERPFCGLGRQPNG